MIWLNQKKKLLTQTILKKQLSLHGNSVKQTTFHTWCIILDETNNFPYMVYHFQRNKKLFSHGISSLMKQTTILIWCILSSLKQTNCLAGCHYASKLVRRLTPVLSQHTHLMITL